jgi:hypothetical protein
LNGVNHWEGEHGGHKKRCQNENELRRVSLHVSISPRKYQDRNYDKASQDLSSRVTQSYSEQGCRKGISSIGSEPREKESEPPGEKKFASRKQCSKSRYKRRGKPAPSAPVARGPNREPTQGEKLHLWFYGGEGEQRASGSQMVPAHAPCARDEQKARPLMQQIQTKHCAHGGQ